MRPEACGTVRRQRVGVSAGCAHTLSSSGVGRRTLTELLRAIINGRLWLIPFETQITRPWRSDMRTLLVTAMFAGGIVAVGPHPPADAAKKYKRSAERYYYSVPRYSRQEVECERARHADPSGVYSGYPCWAQEAFSPKGGRSRR